MENKNDRAVFGISTFLLGVLVGAGIIGLRDQQRFGALEKRIDQMQYRIIIGQENTERYKMTIQQMDRQRKAEREAARQTNPPEQPAAHHP